MTRGRWQRLADRYPALGRLAKGRRRRVPVVSQMAVSDCGAACLAMVLGYHGKTVELDEVRRFMPTSSGGIDAATILRAAEHFGLLGRGVRLETPEDLELLEPGTILHWRFNHFVVLEQGGRRGAWIVDPARGRRFVRRQTLDTHLTGIALTFERTSGFEPGGERPARLKRYLQPLLAFRSVLVRAVVLSLVLQGIALTIPLLIGLIVDRIVPRQDWSLLLVFSVGLVVLACFHAVSGLVRGFLLLHLGTRLDARLSLEFLEHLASLPFSFFQDRSVGDLMMRLNSNRTIREVLTTAALSSVLDGGTVVLYLVLLMVADLRLAAVVVVLGALRVVLLLATWRRQSERTAESLQAQAESRGFQVEILSGVESLKASGGEQRAVERWSHLLVRELNASLGRARIETATRSLLDSLGFVSPLLVLSVGTVLVLRGELSLGAMLALNVVAQGFLNPLGLLVGTGLQLQVLRGYLDRIGEVMEAPRERESPGIRLRRLEGAVRVEAVTFRYGPSSDPALEDVSFEVPPGTFFAVVGASGSGKSTLAAMLAGLYVPQAGRVFYDGVDLQKLDLPWLRGQIGFVSQNPYLFSMTVRENLVLAHPEVAEADVEEAVRQAHVDGDVRALPMGYETLLSAGGTTLSGGQRQRLCLAKALVHRPTVLILDEATSALDARSELEVQRELAAMSCTRIVIAHRLSTIRDADRIVVLDKGRIVQSGRHPELVAQGGAYLDLVSAQMEGQGASGEGAGGVEA